MTNLVILVGRIARDPETRTFPNGDMVANVTVATTDKWRDKSTGESRTATEWHRVSFHGRLAEIASQYLRKGSQVYIEGKLQTREWEKDGIKRYTTEIVVDMQGTMQLLGGRPQGDQQNQGGGNNYQQQQSAPRQQAQRPAPQQQQQSRPAPQQQAPQPAPDFDSFDDDIPF